MPVTCIIESEFEKTCEMGKVFESIDEKLQTFIANQKMFFVASAPESSDGHINLSPKGLDTFRVLGPTTVAYVDFYGSGIETVAHLKENGRIVVMFCAFEGPPKIVRFHGKGEAIEPDHPEFESLLSQFPPQTRVRAIIRIECHRISDSCGFGVPLYDYVGQRDQLIVSAKKKSDEAIAEYRKVKNASSLDGLPGLTN